MDAYPAGLALARSHGHNLAGIHSVASFFVSRVDTRSTGRLTAIGTFEGSDAGCRRPSRTPTDLPGLREHGLGRGVGITPGAFPQAARRSST
jgi:hypothetical protein